MSEVRKVVIVGSGPAGYTAAIYAARANLEPVVFAGGPDLGHDPSRVPGGQLMITTEVENYPGFPEKVTGPELMERFQKQAERFGTRIHLENATQVDLSKRPFTIAGESVTYQAETVIIATGASAKWLGVKGEEAYKNRGVSACATCDELRASKIMQERALKNPKISFLWDSAIEEIVGNEKGATGARVKNLKTGEVKLVEAHGVFVAIGHTPTTHLFKGQLELHPSGYLKVHPGSTRTSVEGVFACGDVADHYYRQAVTAAGTGCMAAIDAERWMTENDIGG